VARAFSPLDEELALWPGACSPSLAEGAARLGTWVPFERLPDLLRQFTGTQLSASTIQRVTEAAGVAAVAVHDQALARLEREVPAPPVAPAVLQVSVDGAMVPLRGKGEWAEVKTVALGEVQPAVVNGRGEREVPVTALSYFSRLADADTFGHLATVETHRRGVEAAGTVCGVVDGAEWCQGFLDLHRPDAIRILDFPHAAGYLAQVAQAGFGADTAATAQWLATQCHGLKHDSPAVVLAAVRTIRETVATRGDAAALAVVDAGLTYLEKREAQLAYATFVAQGYPIGSGIVESANKLVVEARLKGAGMHWARPHVNPMLALRTVVCSDRWDETWPALVRQVRAQRRATAAQRRHTRCARRERLLAPVRAAGSVTTPATSTPTAVEVGAPVASAPLPMTPPATPPPGPTADPAAATTPPQVTAAPRRPAASHPWRRRFLLPKRDAAA
jgi:hypothetical protein